MRGKRCSIFMRWRGERFFIHRMIVDRHTWRLLMQWNWVTFAPRVLSFPLLLSNSIILSSSHVEGLKETACVRLDISKFLRTSYYSQLNSCYYCCLADRQEDRSQGIVHELASVRDMRMCCEKREMRSLPWKKVLKVSWQIFTGRKEKKAKKRRRSQCDSLKGMPQHSDLRNRSLFDGHTFPSYVYAVFFSFQSVLLPFSWFLHKFLDVLIVDDNCKFWMSFSPCCVLKRHATTLSLACRLFDESKMRVTSATAVAVVSMVNRMLNQTSGRV